MSYVMEDFVPVPKVNERVEIMATIVNLKMVDGGYGETLKGLFLCEGTGGRFKLWGSVPTGLLPAFDEHREDNGTLKGSFVKFYAKIDRSDDDECFGFFKRPTKAEILVMGKHGRPQS